MRRCVLVTGASGGIGAAIARRFAESGDDVVLGCHSHPERAQALCNELTAEGLAAKGGRAIVCRADVGKEADVEAMFAEAERAFGPVQVLVNNAGTAKLAPFQDVSPEDWDAMMRVHLRGAYLCCHRALGAMVHAKSGAIVNISSIWGLSGASCEVAYSTAKAGLIGMTRALAKELGPSGVRVNCVAPGAVDTPMMAGFTEAERAAFCEDIPMGRLATPQEIAEAVFFMASPAASYITGQVLSPNGGCYT